jgi:hypothetical protein
MKLLKKTLVAAGIATAVFATGAAQAAIINNPSTALAPAAGNTVTNESVLTVITPANTIVQLEAGESLSIDDSVTFTLSAGTFGTLVGGNLTATGVAGETYALVSGGAGSNSATFRVTGAASEAGAQLTLSGHTITGTGLAANSTILVTVDMSGFVGGAATALYGTPITQINTQLEPAMAAVVTAAGTAGVFDVASGFSTLTAATGTIAGVLSTLDSIATVTTTASLAAVANNNAAGFPIGAPDPSATLIAISGPMNGVDSINSAGTNATNGTGLLVTPAANGFGINVASNTAFGTQIATGLSNIEITFDGTTAYDVSGYSAVVARLPDVAGGYGANANIGGGSLFSFTRNGTAFASNSVGRLSTLTITDRSNNLGAGGANGGIAITAYDQAGNMVACGAGLVIDNLPGNGTVTIQGADIVDNCPGVKRVDGVVNSTSIYVTNTKKSSTGLTQMSGSNAGTQVDI